MLFLLATLAAASTANPSISRQPAQGQTPERCSIPGLTYVRDDAPGHSVRRLGEEPPATAFLAVDRNVGGCPAPAIIRSGIGR